METEEISDRYVAPCFINGLEAYDGEINLEKEENVISNELAVKLCLDHMVKYGHKVVKKELIVALRGEIYFVKFKINPEEDDVKPGVVLGRDILEIEGEEAKREALAIDICRRFAILEEERPVNKTMAYTDKYKKLLDEICLDKMKLDGEMTKEEEEAIIKVKAVALIEKEDPRAFVIPIRLEDKIKFNALDDTGSDINVVPYRVYKELGREELKNVNRGITMLNHSKAELMRLLKDVLCQIHMLKKAVSFVGSLPVALHRKDWKPEYTGNHYKKEEWDR
ncbi:hypothetical protein Tco_0878352 [Tanacetum coccineum]|uniref:Peptidase A2 domain-containing protein n=1 Tax=Tanacetum coccineum TaxID=301880 RepID=A0ABQ5BY35_9ASTR